MKVVVIGQLLFFLLFLLLLLDVIDVCILLVLIQCIVIQCDSDQYSIDFPGT